MTTKDYKLIAKTINLIIQKDFNLALNNLCEELKKDNPLFNREKFLKACLE